MRRLDDEDNPMNDAPRILDMEKWEEVKEKVSIDSETLQDNAVIQEKKDYGDYPAKEYKVLKGFKTWKPENLFTGIWDADNPVRELKRHCRNQWIDHETGGLGFSYNIERFGIPYGTGKEIVAGFFATISLATDPFVVWHSPIQHNFPDLSMMDRNDKEEEIVYRIECRNGSAELYEVTYKKHSEEVIAEASSEGDAE